MFGYKHAAAAILALETSLIDMMRDFDDRLPKIAGIGPASARVIREVLESGGSPTVEHAIDISGRRADIERRRALRRHFLSRAETIRVLHDPTFGGPALSDYRGICKCTRSGATAHRRSRPSPTRATPEDIATPRSPITRTG